MKKYLRYLGPILITAIFLLAVYLLYNKLKAYSIAQIRESILQISYGRIGLSLVLMVINYMILVGYDWLARCWAAPACATVSIRPGVFP